MPKMHSETGCVNAPLSWDNKMLTPKNLWQICSQSYQTLIILDFQVSLLLENNLDTKTLEITLTWTQKKFDHSNLAREQKKSGHPPWANSTKFCFSSFSHFFAAKSECLLQIKKKWLTVKGYRLTGKKRKILCLRRKKVWKD